MYVFRKRTLVIIAIAWNLLVLNGCGVSDDPATRTLVDASARGDDASVSELLLAGVNPNLADGKEGPTPLVIAASRGNKSTIRLLLVGGANINVSAVPGTPLYAAALNGQRDCIVLLKKHGAKLRINEAQANGLRRRLLEQKMDEIKQLLAPEI